MSVDIKDVEQVAQDLQQKFDDFKAKNDKRIDAIEQEKQAGRTGGKPERANQRAGEPEKRPGKRAGRHQASGRRHAK
ncbi:hypothetical protein ECZC06_53930 [Escherichia coli]|nr:hypothetical protein ECZC06_53930 [Escherichia coli]